MDIIEWLDEEAIKILKEEREDCEAPKSHYTPRPNQMGKLFWFSGKGNTISHYLQETNFIPNRPTWSWQINNSSTIKSR